MNLTNKIKPAYIDAFTYLICFIALFLVSWRNPVSFDAFWHLAIGKDVLANGLNYAINLKDEFSFTLTGQAYRSTFLFDAYIAYIVSIFGVSTGFFIIKLIFFSAFLSLIFLLFKRQQVNWKISIITLPFIAYFIQFRATVRPELLSMVLIILSLILFYEAKKSFSNKNLIKISFLLLFWVNYHNPVFGYMIFFALFIDVASNKMRGLASFSWNYWILWGLVIFFIGFLNPELKHFFFNTLDFDPRWKAYIDEYKPVLERFNFPQVYLFLLISVYLAGLLFIKKQYGSFLVVLMLTFFSWKMVRIVGPAAIINLSILSISLSSINWESIYANLKSSVKIIIGGFWIILFLFGLYSLNIFAQGILNNNENYKKLYPAHAIQYLQTKNIPGKIFNQMSTGGYIAYHLGKDYPVYIDGRTNILYPFEYMEHFLKVLNSIELIKQTTENYQIDYLLFHNAANTFEWVNTTGQYYVDYLSDDFLLMSRNHPSFPLSGKLIFRPACWNDRLNNALSDELARKDLLNPGSPLKYTLDLIENNTPENIQKLEITEYLPNQYKRAAAYIVAKHQLWKKAAEFFSVINSREKTMNDWFMMSYFLMRGGYLNDAEQLLHFAIFSKWTLRTMELSQTDKQVLLSLILSVQKQQSLTLIKQSYIEQLQKELGSTAQFIHLDEPLEDFICLSYDKNFK